MSGDPGSSIDKELIGLISKKAPCSALIYEILRQLTCPFRVSAHLAKPAPNTQLKENSFASHIRV